MSKILAAVILFNPNIKQLERSLAPIIPNVDQIRFIDNASKNHQEIESFITKISNATIQRNEKNIGLSKPFNSLIKYSRENDFSYLLLLDQDSEPAPNFIEELKKNICNEYVCLVPFLKHKSEEYQKYVGNEINGCKEIINEAINSGTLINVNVLPQNISFDEHLFIDWIDIDFFRQLKIAQKKVLRINTTHLLVNIGNQKIHHFLKYTWFSSGYSAFRLNKQAQDTVYFYFKNRHQGFTKGHITFVLWRWLMMLFFEKNKIKKTYAIISGLFQGIVKLQKYSIS